MDERNGGKRRRLIHRDIRYREVMRILYDEARWQVATKWTRSRRDVAASEESRLPSNRPMRCRTGIPAALLAAQTLPFSAIAG